MAGPFYFGASSTRALKSVHHDLSRLAQRVIVIYDFSAIQGARTVEEQIHNIRKGVSKTIDSRHIPRGPDGHYDPTIPGMALDLAPYPNAWPQDSDRRSVREKKKARFYYLAGLIRMAAADEGVEIVQGVDWDRDGDFFDQTFDDLPHVQLAVKLPRLWLPEHLLIETNEALVNAPRGPLPEYRNP